MEVSLSLSFPVSFWGISQSLTFTPLLKEKVTTGHIWTQGSGFGWWPLSHLFQNRVLMKSLAEHLTSDAPHCSPNSGYSPSIFSWLSCRKPPQLEISPGLGAGWFFFPSFFPFAFKC